MDPMTDTLVLGPDAGQKHATVGSGDLSVHSRYSIRISVFSTMKVRNTGRLHGGSVGAGNELLQMY